VSVTTLSPPPVISGIDPACEWHSSIFTASNWQHGSYTWDVGGSVAENWTNAHSVSVTATRAGSGWIRVMSGTTELARHDVRVGASPVISYIEGENFHHTNTNGWYFAHLEENTPANFTWYMRPDMWSGFFLSHHGSSDAFVFFYKSGYYELYVIASNACGTSRPRWIGITVRCNYNCSCCWSPSNVLLYPNPVVDILYVEFDQEVVATRQREDIVYDVRLFDGQGNMVRQTTTRGGTVQFNVANLPVGIYYLHIFDGLSGEPQIQQIMVER